MRYAGLAAAVTGAILFGLAVPFAQFRLSVGVLLALFLICVALIGLGIWDMLQRSHSLKRNYPILANLRFLLEKVRPEIRQYFLESETDGTPFNRDQACGRLPARQEAARQAAVRHPAGHLCPNYEWITHSIAPRGIPTVTSFRVVVGGPDCKEPYSVSLLNISAMSFGALSANAIRALNKGAKIGGFAHDTGEGGFSPYHREFGGDIIWEIGSGYFGCRNPTARSVPRTSSRSRARPGQNDRDQAIAGRQARPRRRAAGRQGVRRNRRHPRRADGARLRLAGAAFGVFARRSR